MKKASIKHKNNKAKKTKKKGFTLVELLAVIIILAIVVGITIPAVMTTLESTRKKAFQVAANSMADWVDREYSAYLAGGDTSGAGMLTLSEDFANLCLRKCGQDPYKDYNKSSSGVAYSDFNSCYCTIRINALTADFVKAAGLKPANFDLTLFGSDSNRYNSLRLSENGEKVMRANRDDEMSGTGGLSLNGTSTYRRSRVYIDASSGRSCVTLISSADTSDYPAGKIACGGLCQSDDPTTPNYCKPTE